MMIAANKTVILKIKTLAKKHKKALIFLLSFGLVILLVFSFLKLCINPIIVETIEVKTKALATRAMNGAIAEVVTNSIVYSDIIHTVTDAEGNITFIQANSLQVNNLSRKLAQATENKIDELGDQGVSIPLGSFTGVPIFVGLGPSIKLNVEPIGAVSCTFSSKFENAGINQTNHKIYITIVSTIGIIMPLLSVKHQQQQQVLICESIIVGHVPEVYLYSDNLDNLLNFVPIT